jgi:hypothetical protein
MDMQVLVRNATTFNLSQSVTAISLLVQAEHFTSHTKKKSLKMFMARRENTQKLGTLLRKNMDFCSNVLNLIC